MRRTRRGREGATGGCGSSRHSSPAAAADDRRGAEGQRGGRRLRHKAGVHRGEGPGAVEGVVLVVKTQEVGVIVVAVAVDVAAGGSLFWRVARQVAEMIGRERQPILNVHDAVVVQIAA